MNLSSPFQLIAQQASISPDATAINSDGGSLSFAQLLQIQNDFGNYLRNKGVEVDSKVALILSQGPTMAICALSVAQVATCVPLNPDYTSEELQNCLNQIQPILVITTRELNKKVLESHLDDKFKVIEVELTMDFKGLIAGSVQIPTTDATSLPNTKGNTIAYQLFTSGSTSQPKMVPLTHEQLLVSTQNLISSLRLSAEDRCLNMMTMFHVGGLLDLLIAPLSVGCQVFITSEIGSHTFFKVAHDFKPTYLQAVPTLLKDFLNYAEIQSLQKETISPLRFIRSVSAPLTIDLAQRAEAFFNCKVIEIYGMTETAGVISSNPLPPGERKISSVGVPVNEVKVQIIDSQNNPLGSNEVGKIIVKGKNVFKGYVTSQLENQSLFVGEWFITGDLGYKDEEGYLFLTGRIKDMINRGGEKISPLEIDWVIQQHPSVLEAACFAIPHKNLGEEVAAAIVLNSNNPTDKEDIQGFLASKISQFKIPRKIYFVEELPKNLGGKLQRHRLTEQFSDNDEHSSTFSKEQLTTTEEAIAQVWRSVLEINEVRKYDNFFDLGGDSLRAVLLISELETTLKLKVDPRIIYEFPLLNEFTKEVEGGITLKKKNLPTSEGDLKAELERLMAHWLGKRYTSDGLIVGRNSVGTKTPIYWCTNGLDYFNLLENNLQKDQPVYGFVSLLFSPLRSEENNSKAAEIYAREILENHPHREIILGGWCEGAKIVIDMANRLSENGIKINLLFLQDSFIPKRYNGRVSLFFSEYGMDLFRRQFQDPDFGFSKYYSGGFSCFYERVQHEEFFLNAEVVKAFVGRFERVLRGDSIIGYEVGRSEPNHRIGKSIQVLEEKDCKAVIKIMQPPLLLSRTDEREIKLVIENQAQTTWRKTEESGIKIMVNCIDVYYRRLATSFIRLDNDIDPKEKVEVSAFIKLPKDTSSVKLLFLEADLIDDGVSRFSAYRSKYFRFPALTTNLVLYPLFLADSYTRWIWLEKVILPKFIGQKSLMVQVTNYYVKLARLIKNYLNK